MTCGVWRTTWRSVEYQPPNRRHHDHNILNSLDTPKIFSRKKYTAKIRMMDLQVVPIGFGRRRMTASVRKVSPSRMLTDRPDLRIIFVGGSTPGPALRGEIVLRRPVAGTDLAAAVLAVLDGKKAHRPTPGARLLKRLRTPVLRAAYLAWNAARLPGERLLRLERFNLAPLDLQDHGCLIAVRAGAADELTFTLSPSGQRSGRAWDRTWLKRDHRGRTLWAPGSAPTAAACAPGRRCTSRHVSTSATQHQNVSNVSFCQCPTMAPLSATRSVSCSSGTIPPGEPRRLALQPTERRSGAMEPAQMDLDAPDLVAVIEALSALRD